MKNQTQNQTVTVELEDYQIDAMMRWHLNSILDDYDLSYQDAIEVLSGIRFDLIEQNILPERESVLEEHGLLP